MATIAQRERELAEAAARFRGSARERFAHWVVLLAARLGGGNYRRLVRATFDLAATTLPERYPYGLPKDRRRPGGGGHDD